MSDRSRWTHAICRTCWNAQHPGLEPVRVKDDETTQCCFCLSETAAGIYVRADPAATPCGGNHG